MSNRKADETEYGFDTSDRRTSTILQIYEHITKDDRNKSTAVDLEFLRSIFVNLRIKYSVDKKIKTLKGIRLSRKGLKILSQHLESYHHAHSTHLDIKILLRLDQRVTRPYFITNNELILFDEIDSWSFQMGNSCLETWLSNISS